MGTCKGHDSENPALQVKAQAEKLGFCSVGITSADPAGEAGFQLEQWVHSGYAASMKYLERQNPRRAYPKDLLPQVESVICLAFNYYPGEIQSNTNSPFLGRIARYATGLDYHQVLKKKLREIERFLVQLGGPETRTRSFVDTGPLLEKEFARRAGLGFIGKNTLLIAPQHGSYLFLAEVLTNLPLDTDPEDHRDCGDCRACLEACPTGALVKPYLLDARKCIAYWTTQHQGEISLESRTSSGPWVFGCDLCQEVCPYNAKPQITPEATFQQGVIVETQVSLNEILVLENDELFLEKFAGSPIENRGREGILQSALCSAASQGPKEWLPPIRRLAQMDSSPIIRELAGWTMNRLEQQK